MTSESSMRLMAGLDGESHSTQVSWRKSVWS
jgi:hypothetical protein